MNDTKSRPRRKVAVLGPIPRDQIVTYTGERFETIHTHARQRAAAGEGWSPGR